MLFLVFILQVWRCTGLGVPLMVKRTTSVLFSFDCMGPRDWTPSHRLGAKCL